MATARCYEDLVVWRRSHQLALVIYRLTADYPKSELFGLVSQMRRAAVSVPANITEGFRRRSRIEKARFVNIAHASLDELDYFLLLSGDLGYATVNELRGEADQIGRLLYAFEQSIRSAAG